MRHVSRKKISRPGSKAASLLALQFADDGDGWTCLGRRSPASAARSVAAALRSFVALPAARCTAAILLSHDAQVRVLNKQWRGFDKPTNVLSFPSGTVPGPARSRHLGDIILAQETLVREARDLGIDVGDHYRHLVLHGLLHLLGYDHETDAQAEEMEALETSILASLGIADPYADTEPVTAPMRPSRRARRRLEVADKS